MALTCSEAEREVDEKEVYGFEFELNDESFKAIVEVVETFAADSTAGEDGIGLFIKDGETIEEATLAGGNSCRYLQLWLRLDRYRQCGKSRCRPRQGR